MINGATQLLMMKADVLNGFDRIQVCTRYKLKDGSISDHIPFELVHEPVTPVYRELPGWNCEITGGSWDQMPKPLREYVEFIEAELKVPVKMLSFGPDRTQTILR